MEPFSDAEYRARQDKVRVALQERGAAGGVFFDALTIRYLCGFYFIPTERPMALLLNTEGAARLLVPFLEGEHAEGESSAIDGVETYPEYPGERHPMQFLGDICRRLGFADRKIGADRPAYGGFGYKGATVADVSGAAEVMPIGDIVDGMRVCKERREVDMIAEAARWGDVAHSLLQRYSGPGCHEMDVSARASMEATQEMLEAMGPGFKPKGGGAHAGFRGQIGANSALPHAVNLNLEMKPGDTLVTGAAANVWGYNSELERTMFVGEPNADQKRFFQHMLDVQDIALESIKPGRPCSDVDRAVLAYFEEHDLMRYWRHHCGHNIGLNYHEPPFLDRGDQTILQPGMLFTVEPGLYVEGLGGFRHSDTVVVTEDGIEFLTHYPRDLESLICG